MIDEEVKRIILTAYNKAKDLLKDNMGLLHATTRLLLEKETIDGKEIDELIKKIEDGTIEPKMLTPIDRESEKKAQAANETKKEEATGETV